ncbi:MAG: ribonuclease P protein component [Desulfohalobiaceae bacterium]
MSTTFTFPRSRRLTQRQEYLACYRRGKKYHSRNFILFVLPANKPGRGFRLGIAASKKVGGAVTRNRIKRLVREYFRLKQGSLDPDLDIAVVAKKGVRVEDLDYWLVKQDLDQALERICRKTQT